MYAVVGCPECEALWIVDGRPNTTTCPRCSTRHQYDRLRKLTETPDLDAAREARTSLLADRTTHPTTIPEDTTPDQPQKTPSGPAVILEAVAATDPPTEDAIVAYATDYGLAPDTASALLEKLRTAGRLTKTGPHYRRV